MRLYDDNKKEKIFNTTIDFVVEYGIESLSMSKLAKEIGISQSTIYVYYQSKEDLIENCYHTVKDKIGKCSIENINSSMSAKEITSRYMENILKFIKENLNYLLFIEMNFLNLSKSKKIYIQKEVTIILEMLDEKIKNGELQNYPAKILLMYCYYPLLQLAREYKVNPDLDIEKRFQILKELSWNAIKK